MIYDEATGKWYRRIEENPTPIDFPYFGTLGDRLELSATTTLFLSALIHLCKLQPSRPIRSSLLKWKKETRLSRDNIQSARDTLRELGLLEYEIPEHSGYNCTEYRLNVSKINDIIKEINEGREIG